MLLLPDRDPQYNSKAKNKKELKTMNMRLKEDSELETIQQSWKNHSVQNANGGAGLDLLTLYTTRSERVTGRHVTDSSINLCVQSTIILNNAVQVLEMRDDSNRLVSWHKVDWYRSLNV